MTMRPADRACRTLDEIRAAARELSRTAPPLSQRQADLVAALLDAAAPAGDAGR
jgi:hypothetical protein